MQLNIVYVLTKVLVHWLKTVVYFQDINRTLLSASTVLIEIGFKKI